MKPDLKIITLVIFWHITITVYGQGQWPVQRASLYAPDNKPEALFSAPVNKFKAYNKANHLYYTIANDESNLYLVVRTTDKLITQKIVRWGLALIIDTSGRIGPHSPSVSFPVPDGDKNLNIIREKNMATNNARMADLCKLIAINGLTGIDGRTISIYNTDGIKAKSLFNDQLEYTYQLTVPLKYFSLSVKNKTWFRYTIQLNGPTEVAVPAGTRPPPDMPVRTDGIKNPDTDYLFSKTSFSGECTLAAK